MLHTVNLSCVLLAFSVFCRSSFILGVSSDHQEVKEVVKGEHLNAAVQTSSINTTNVIKKSDQVITIPLSKSTKSTPENLENHSSKETSQFILEGGDIVVQSSTSLPSNRELGSGTVDDGSNHSKGSKGRKGVQYPGSSVVPRKGVDQQGVSLFHSNQSSVSVTSDPGKESTNIITSSKIPLNNTETQILKSGQEQVHDGSAPKLTHAKKPEILSDIGDEDDFDNYSIIKTSTTGEDYIIIGIVIVLGIWCSIFGALIFYRRAGEYWDRRHYRRMDFLVEGMYND